jgi:hypothetical protein
MADNAADGDAAADSGGAVNESCAAAESLEIPMAAKVDCEPGTSSSRVTGSTGARNSLQPAQESTMGIGGPEMIEEGGGVGYGYGNTASTTGGNSSRSDGRPIVGLSSDCAYCQEQRYGACPRLFPLQTRVLAIILDTAF